MRFPGEEACGTRRAVRRAGTAASGWVGPPGVDGQDDVRLGRGGRSSVDERVRASPRAACVGGWCGPALPSPTSGGPARLHPPARERGREVGGQRRARRRPAAPRDRVREREPRGVQELALEPVRGPARRTPGRPRPGWPIASRCARIWCVRPVSSRTRSSVSRGSARSTSKCVTASRGSSVSVEMRVRTRRSRPSGASIVPRARRRPALDEREVLAHELAPRRAAP